jgi:hypothetical protein
MNRYVIEPAKWHRRFFEFLDELFECAFGSGVTNTTPTFSRWIRNNADKFAP